MPERSPFGRLPKPFSERVSAWIAACCVHAPERKQQRWFLWRRLKAGLELRHRLVVFPHFCEHQSQQLPGLHEGGIRRVRRFEGVDRGTERPRTIMGQPEIYPRRIQLRIERQRTLVGRHRLLVFTKTRQHGTEIGVGFGQSRIGFDCSTIRGGGAWKISALLRLDAGAKPGLRRLILRQRGGRIALHEQKQSEDCGHGCCGLPCPFASSTKRSMPGTMKASRVPSGQRTTMRSMLVAFPNPKCTRRSECEQ
jgi:hypothetical protein